MYLKFYCEGIASIIEFTSAVNILKIASLLLGLLKGEKTRRT
jgi:hypothetical protein